MNRRRISGQSQHLGVEVLEDRTAPAILGLSLPSVPLLTAQVVQSADGPGYLATSIEVEIVPMQLQASQPTLLQDGELPPPVTGPGEQSTPTLESHVWSWLLKWRYGSSRSQFVQRTTGFANGQATVLSGPSAVYQAPSFASAMVKPILGMAQNGETFTILGFERGFVKVEYQGKIGWVHSNAFVKTKVIPPPPSDTPASPSDGVGTGPKG